MSKNSRNKYTFLDLIYDTLKEEKKPLTINEIWESAIRTGKTEKLGSKGKTPTDTIRAVLYLDLKNNEETHFIKLFKRPATFGLSEIDYGKIEQDSLSPNEKEKRAFKERDLHPLLSSFVYCREEFSCQTKTIFHEKTSRTKKGVNEWLHPDIVGIHYPYGDYSSDVIGFLFIT